ncbi:MAG: hypothetical protein ACERKN_07315 [Velocimicrobium sp.]
MKQFFFPILLCSAVMLLTSCGVSNEAYNAVVAERDSLQTQYQDLNNDYTALKKVNQEYEEIIEPYKDLTEAEILENTNKANLKAKKDKLKLEELNTKEAAEKAAEKKAEKKEKEKEEKKGYDTDITYDQIARTPDDYLDKKVKFSGIVLQVMEGTNSTQIRLAIDKDYDQVIYCEYASDIVKSRILDDDIITLYGVSKGLLSYKSTLGGTITIPSVLIDKIDQ